MRGRHGQGHLGCSLHTEMHTQDRLLRGCCENSYSSMPRPLPDVRRYNYSCFELWSAPHMRESASERFLALGYSWKNSTSNSQPEPIHGA